MRVLVLTLGSRGDVEPFAALGVALKARGHAVTLATAKGYDDLLSRHGITYAPLDVDLRALALTPGAQAALRSPRAALELGRQLGPTMRRLLDGSWAISREIRPEVIVFHPKALAGPHLAEKLGIPALVAAAMPLLTPTGAFPSPILPVPRGLGFLGNRLSHRLVLAGLSAGHRRLTNRWRAETLSLSPRPWFGDDHAPHGAPLPRLYAYSPALVPFPDDWGPENHVTGAWTLGPEPAWSPPDDLVRFLASGPPPIYVGFGSMTGANAQDLASCVLDALKRSGQRGVLARGWGGLSLAAKVSPETVHLIDETPHDWLFPQMAAVVHHGGAGTTHAGLRAGKPSLICPVFGDQPFWGRQVHRLGAGPAPISQARLTSESLASAFEVMTADDHMRARTEALGRLLRKERGTELAGALVERSACGRTSRR